MSNCHSCKKSYKHPIDQNHKSNQLNREYIDSYNKRKTTIDNAFKETPMEEVITPHVIHRGNRNDTTKCNQNFCMLLMK